jgi:XTP/dITP diphosphohydrolase
MNDQIVLATGNRHKLNEIKEMLKGLPLSLLALADFKPMPEPAEDGATFAENASAKATYYARFLGLPCLADDTGLVVDVLEGRPGVHSARYAGPTAIGGENCAKLLGAMAGHGNRSAHFACVLTLAAPDGQTLSWEGRCDGEILANHRGAHGFGYDSLFLVPELGKTLAEIPLDEIGAFSHRGKALAQFIADFSMVQRWLRQRMPDSNPGPCDLGQGQRTYRSGNPANPA